MDAIRTSEPLTHAQKLNVVSINELKLHARIIEDDENALLGEFIEAAFDHLHGPTGWLNGYCLLEETWRFYLPSTLTFGLEVPVRPLIAVTAFEYLGSDGTTYEAVPTDRYRQIGYGDHAQLVRTSLPYPYFGTSHPRAYRVTVTAGHPTAAEVPSPLRMAIKLLAAHFYQNREVMVVEKGSPMAFGLQSLAGRYRVSPDHS